MDEFSDFSDSGSEYIPSESGESSDAEASHDEQLGFDEGFDVVEQDPQPSTSGLAKIKSRKRSRNEKNWKINTKKILRNTGKEYISRRGLKMNAKQFENIDCNCRKKCIDLFSFTERQNAFESFWRLGDYVAQNSYIFGLVKASPVNRKRPKDGSRLGKHTHFQYVLKTNNKTHRVCKKYFLDTFKISNGRLHRCISKREASDCRELRGTTGSRKLDDSDIVRHIKTFPAYQSHYSRIKNPNRKYLNSGLTVKKMYDLYVEECRTQNIEPKKLKYYYQVFNTKFNLHFKIPHQDTCKLCDDLELKLKGADNEDIKKNLSAQKELHLRKAESARECLRNDSKKAAEAYIVTFDLQKALPFPKLTTSVAYYKRNLYLYNLGIHSFNSNTGYMYVWNETQGGRGSQDIATCLVKHLKLYAGNHKHVIAYSDSCTGQNRNIKMSLSLLKLVQDPEVEINVIDLKFLVSGHSFLPNDGEFGIIESESRRHGMIYHPDEWIDIIKNSKRKEPKFVVSEIQHEEFLSTTNLENLITNRKTTTDGYNFSWLKIRWLRFQRDLPLQFQFKETLNPETEFHIVDLSKKKSAGRPSRGLTNVMQQPLYHTRRTVTAAKKKDMMDLLPYIPPVHHNLYKNLPTETVTRGSAQQNLEDRSSDDEMIYD